MTLIDRRNFHLFQPLLYQVATGALSPGDIAQPLRSILRKQRNTTVILGEAIGHRPRAPRGPPVGRRPDRLRHADRRDRRASHLLRPSRVGADRAGAQDDRGRDRDPPPDPHRLRGGRARGRPGPAARVDDVRARRRRTDRRRAGRARSARSPATRSSATSGRSIPSDARIILVEAMDRVLPPYPPDRSASAQRQLERLGVEVRHEDPRHRHRRAAVRVVAADGPRSRSRPGPCCGRPAS